TSGLIAFPRL
uniref:Periviscerokinin-2 n=1 Tax=Polyspilota aeruginosa TaxID=444978 RepID=PVK2_POLAI|nr:RecName: Full=Periviscerokinin-2; Short=Polae-PVK-2 [Polyspilota aeruginosa]